MNGVAALALPDRVPLPVFCTTKGRSSVEPTATDPYACEAGVTEIAGTEQVVGAVALTVDGVKRSTTAEVCQHVVAVCCPRRDVAA